MKANRKVPVVLLSGFLGSGKTTLLNRLLRLPGFENTLVIINEFGEVSIDHLLVEQATETVFEMAGGCVCCTVRNDLVETLLAIDLHRFDRIVIETTGIANPVPVFQALAADPALMENLAPASIVTVVDAMRGLALIEAHEEAACQVAMADKLVLTKTAITAPDKELVTGLRKINAFALVTEDRKISRPADLLGGSGEVREPLKASMFSDHSADYNSLVLKSKKQLAASDLAGLLHLMVSRVGPGLLRIKGVSRLVNQSVPVSVQVSGVIVHDFADLETSKEQIDGIRLVVITKGRVAEEAKVLFDGFTGNLSTDTADRDALLNNPLSVPGM